MAYNLGDIADKVRLRVRDTAFDTNLTRHFINDAQNDVFNEYRLPFMQTTQGYTLTVNVSDITNGSGLPANYVQALDLVLTTGGQEKVLTYVDVREIDNIYPDPDDTTAHAANVPHSWYYYAETIRVFPVPSSAYTVTLRYYKKPTELSSDSDVPEIPSEFEELLVTGAAYRIMQVKDNYDQAGVLQNKYDEILAKLVMRYSTPQVGTPLRMRINRVSLGKSHF